MERDRRPTWGRLILQTYRRRSDQQARIFGGPVL